MNDSLVNVLVVDDSAMMRMLLTFLLKEDARIRVIGEVSDGRSALDFLEKQKPDVILMDIHMPGMDGFDTTRRIMETQPVPIIICTATGNPRELATTFRVMEAGAVACVPKPVAPDHPDFAPLAANIRETVLLMSEVRVVRRWARTKTTTGVSASLIPVTRETRIIGIGASTGGPPVLQSILAELPKESTSSVLIVQHITHGFLPGLVDWLNQTGHMPVEIASHGTFALPGRVYFAADDLHMSIERNGRIVLAKGELENGVRPSISHLFRSLADAYGPSAAGVLLTGMGKDGADGLLKMKESGACTIAQDAESSVVHGMPGEAIALGAASHVLSPEGIASMLRRISGSPAGRYGGGGK